MGCDIHAMIEKKNKLNWWINAGKPEIDRNYQIFSVLTNVRNYDEIPFISNPRGIPEDCCDEFEAWSKQWDSDGHSHSYVTLREMQDFDTEQKFQDRRLITGKDADGRITSVCRATTGEHFGEVGENTVFGLWGSEAWDSLIAQLEKIGPPDAVRLVFFFDS